ncbi:MAG: hemolysin family protein [Gemmatimonadota bacterium]
MIGPLLLLVPLLALSAFFSVSEIALLSLSEAKVKALVVEKRTGARAVAELKASPERLLITILIGNNAANIAAACVATWIATGALGSAGVGLAIGVMTLLVLFFAEITPRSFGARHAVRLALLAAPILRLLSRPLLPLVAPFEALVHRVLPIEDGSGRSVSEREIRAMTRRGHLSGEIEEHERRLIERAFTLDKRRAWEVMTPRVEVFAWKDSHRLSDIARELPRVPYSRIPVFGESLDDITGVLYLRDAYQALLAGQRDVTLADLAREPLFVPESLSLIRLLEEFRTRRIHVGVVVDEHGGVDGLVTMEDILEELVGEIVDETDVPEEPIVRVNRHEILVDGSAELREINHFFNTAFPVLEHRSLNGYLLEELGRVPQAGEVVEREGVRIEVLRASETQVTRARLSRPPPLPEEPEAAPLAVREPPGSANAKDA